MHQEDVASLIDCVYAMCEAKMDRIEWGKKDKSTITVRDFNSPHQQLMQQVDRK